ncbi:hypothetical protein EVAR_76828_1 [Eumeta japonica]|uniref:Uncharacterized protein n=1 Tax=Eumeta variegata TaxID=151549 RepID=A0A4C1Z770_EUMVA|nr:hypothetical protein EVAR_76828_1 [Eumeta japonica]
MWRNGDRRSRRRSRNGVGKRPLLSIYGSEIFGESRLLAPCPSACQFYRCLIDATKVQQRGRGRATPPHPSAAIAFSCISQIGRQSARPALDRDIMFAVTLRDCHFCHRHYRAIVHVRSHCGVSAPRTKGRFVTASSV